MRKLTEAVGIVSVASATNVAPGADVVMENLMSEWAGVPYPQLSVILVLVQFLAFVHQTHHWTAKGDPFYGDHLLFMRLYEETSGEIDKIAEKVIGLGGAQNVNLARQVNQYVKLVQSYGSPSTIPQASDLAQRSLVAEKNFIQNVTFLMKSMDESGTMTKGLDNLLAGVLDIHEGHVYLLKQRCGA
jgi:DNA-binding ferritin-like protein